MDILTAPPVAFVIYLLLVGILSGIGRVLAGTSRANATKSSPYSSGEAAPSEAGVPGYSPFFSVALFFAVLHLGMVVLATGGLSPIAGVYLLGLMLALVALIRG